MKEIDANEFMELIKGKVAVQFSATWCGPCKSLTKTILSNSQDFSVPFYKIDIDGNQHLAGKHSVRSVPTLVLFDGGVEINRMIGAKSLEKIKEFLGQ